jgi:hypothetical protein
LSGSIHFPHFWHLVVFLLAKRFGTCRAKIFGYCGGMKKLTSIEAVLDEFGGAAATARLLGRKRTTVGMWKANGRFPSSSYLAMDAVFRERGIECPPELWGMDPPPSSTREATP